MQIITKEPEQRLLEMANGIRREADEWRAVHFAFSQLLEHYRADTQMRIAINLVHDLLRGHEGGVFVCGDSELYLLCHDVAQEHMDKVIFQLRYLFADDPLAYLPGGEENPAFCTSYRLAHDYEQFHGECRLRLAKVNRWMRHELAQGEAQKNTAAEPGDGLRRFTSTDLVHIEEDLIKADITRALRRQPICAAMKGSPVRRVFDEAYVHITHLRQLMKMQVDLLSDRWLFKYLTQILDRKMLELLAMQPVRYLNAPTSVNLNVGTVLSNTFHVFDQRLEASHKVSMVVELHIADVFADIPAFNAARELLQERGYRVCLDGLTVDSFAQIDRVRLGFDLAKFQWNASLAEEASLQENADLIAAVKRCGTGRIILCRCDDVRALAYGHALGVSLFQGRHFDRLVNPAAKIEN